MSYANGTAHYNLPQTVGTDKRDWFDTNQAFADIDAALFGAAQQASAVASEVTALGTRVGTVESDVADLKSSRTTDEARISALETLGAQHTTDIADVKADALDMICAIDEGTAQIATVAVEAGKYFRYNDVLYMATINIGVGDVIVPNTNCRATNVATELQNIEGGGGEAVDSVARAEIGTMSSLQTTDKSSLVAAINEVLSRIGGENMTSRQVTFSESVPAGGADITVDLTSNPITDLSKCQVLVSGESGAGAQASLKSISASSVVLHVYQHQQSGQTTATGIVQIIEWS